MKMITLFTFHYQMKVTEIDDDYTKYDSATYYSVAHNITEQITEQPTIMVNGTLKPYQVNFLGARCF